MLLIELLFVAIVIVGVGLGVASVVFASRRLGRSRRRLEGLRRIERLGGATSKPTPPPRRHL